MELRCISCGRPIASNKYAVIFKCPKCGKVEIARCEHCRRVGTRYICPECGFEGP